MRLAQIEEVLAHGSSEAAAVLQLAWQAGLLVPLRQASWAVSSQAVLEAPGCVD